MMKLKKVLALLVCFALIISVFPALAQTEDIKWVCKRSTRIRNSETGELWYPEIPEGYGDYFVDWSGISHDTPDWWGHSLHISNSNGWLSYRVPVEEAGVYELFTKAGTYPDYGADIQVEVNGSVASTAKIDTGDWEPNVTVSLGYIPLNEGDNDIKIIFSFRSGGALAIYYYWLEPVEAPVVNGFYSGGSELTEGTIIPRGTDCIELGISNPIDPDSLTEAEVILTDGEKIISTVNESDNNRLVMSLTDSLSYDGNYTLSVRNIKDIYGYIVDEACIGFTASGADNDSGTAAAIITEAPDMQNTQTMMVSGVIQNSNGNGIAGRRAYLEITAPSGVQLSVEEDISGENGVVEFSYELPDDALAGIYGLKLTCEYFDEGAFDDVRYISEELKNQILGEIKNTSNAEEVEEIFTAYSQELGINSSDLDEITDSVSGEVLHYGISDKDSFYLRFAGREFDNINEFAEEYELNISLERFIQNPSAIARESILKNTAFPGVDKSRVDYIEAENSAAFFNDIAELTRDDASTPEKLGEAYNNLTNKYFLIQNSKGDISLSIGNLTVYKGQQAQFGLNCENVEDMTSYTLNITSDGDLEDALSISVSDGAEAKKTTEGNTVSFDVSNINDALSSLGTVTYDTLTTGQYTFDFNGTAVYKQDDFPYDMYVKISPCRILVDVVENTVSPKPSYSSSSSSKGNGGGGMGGISIPSVIPANTQVFTDLDDAEWAKDSVNYLYNKGIISPAPDKKFRPNDSVTRAEFVKMLVMSLGIDNADSNVEFDDVGAQAWYYKYVMSAAGSGIIMGNNGCFDPDGNITRQDICVILSRVMDKLGYTYEDYTQLFADDDKIADYATDAVYRLRDFGVINGVGDNRFEPQGFATRAMTAKIIEQFLKGVKA